MTGIQQRGRQRRADLVGQRGDHAPEGGQALVASQLILQAPGFRQVGQQYQLPGLTLQGTGGDGQATPILHGNLVTIILARREVARDHLAPEHAHQRLAEHAARHRIGFAHHALAVDNDHAAGQQVEQALQSVGQALLLRQFLHALGTDQGQLALELADPRLEHAVGAAQLRGHLIEQGEGLLQAGTAGLLDRCGSGFRDGGRWGGLAHALLSGVVPSVNGRSRES